MDNASRKMNKSDDRYEFRGVKIAHELMVDILGGLIPGALFLFNIILCIVFPGICYSNSGNGNFRFLVKDGDWFWIVAFLSFLILSYVIGHLFYRADIKKADRADIRREQRKKLKRFIEGLPNSYKDSDDSENENKESKGYDQRIYYAATLLKYEIDPLKSSLEKLTGNFRKPYDEEYKNCCERATNYLNHLTIGTENKTVASKDYQQFRKDILCVLFPETIKSMGENGEDHSKGSQSPASKTNGNSRLYKIAENLFPEISRLPFPSLSVLYDSVRILHLIPDKKGKEVLRWWNNVLLCTRLFLINHGLNHGWTKGAIDLEKGEKGGKDDDQSNIFRVLTLSYLILHMQNESGCATEKRCDFPYMSYYKYLLKRGQLSLLRYVDWTTAAARTKNRINQYKIELQLNVPEAYSILNKNESHVRMASSTWHVARTIRSISWFMIIVMSILATITTIYQSPNRIDKTKDTRQTSYSLDLSVSEGVHTSFTSVPAPTADAEDSHNDNKDNNNDFVQFIKEYMPFIAQESIANCYLAVIFPIISLLLAVYILRNVPRFIHYQRLREIYYTLKVYELWQEASNKRDRSIILDARTL